MTEKLSDLLPAGIIPHPPGRKERSPSIDPSTRLDRDADFDLAKTQREVQASTASDRDARKGGEAREDVSAADYDPSFDRKEDEIRGQRYALRRGEETITHQKPSQKDKIIETAAGVGEPLVRASSSRHEDDGDSDYEEIEVDDVDDVDDMFAVADEPPKRKTIRVKKSKGAVEAVSCALSLFFSRI